MQTVYTNKEIWKIAYPCLVSLVMEQLIGMTRHGFSGGALARWNSGLRPSRLYIIW